MTPIPYLPWIALAWTLSLAVASYAAYDHGKDVQKGETAKQNEKQLRSDLALVAKAQQDAAAARVSAIEAAERYAATLAEARADVQVITKEVPRYVAANPAPTACDLDDWLFGTLNEAAAQTHK